MKDTKLKRKRKERKEAACGRSYIAPYGSRVAHGLSVTPGQGCNNLLINKLNIKRLFLYVFFNTFYLARFNLKSFTKNYFKLIFSYTKLCVRSYQPRYEAWPGKKCNTLVV
jgi:hypothetical protein